MQPLIQVFTHHIKPWSRPWRVWNESCKIPHAKSTQKTNGFLKKKTRGLMRIWAHRWLQQSCKYVFKVSHGELPHWLLRKHTHFPNVFYCFSSGASLALLSCEASLSWKEKFPNNAILAHFASHCSHKRFGIPKEVDFLPLLWPHLGRQEGLWDGFSEKDTSMCVPASF